MSSISQCNMIEQVPGGSVPDFYGASWIGFFAPARTNPEVATCGKKLVVLCLSIESSAAAAIPATTVGPIRRPIGRLTGRKLYEDVVLLSVSAARNRAA
jgi:hypothetical protein